MNPPSLAQQIVSVDFALRLLRRSATFPRAVEREAHAAALIAALATLEAEKERRMSAAEALDRLAAGNDE
jgi:hypothetical protein